MHMWTPDAKLVNSPSSRLSQEVQAIVDEAHRLGLKVACRIVTGGRRHGQLHFNAAAVDAPNHLLWNSTRPAIKVTRSRKSFPSK